MTRQCERPDCSERATVAYRFDAGRRIVFFDHLRDGDPQAAGALCNRHAQVMVLPRGWFLDDRRVPVPRLFATPTERPPRSTRRKTVATDAHPTEQLTVVQPMLAEIDPEEGNAETEVGAPAPAAWSPDFDPGDDLGGLLSATTPLLSRAFGSAPRPDELDEA